MEKYLEQMVSYKGLFMRSFFMCKDCHFVWTALGQANHNMEGCCPSCGEYNYDYAPKSARDKFVQSFKDELKVFEKELKDD